MTVAARPQHMKALAQANRVRAHVASLRRDLSTGRLLFKDIDLDDPILQGIRVTHLLTALPWKVKPRKESIYVSTTGRNRVDRLMQSFGATSDRLRIGSLSAVRKRELKRLVAEKCPSQRPSDRTT